ncbi:MAG: hypothetical protein BWZ02_01073 [Lentisphaerae bacterium ADurb.BinA184]|nr:MAG: hypothetical protein BWZ02_01073 [Lentisphaerae bacterium ADurb.BinA184]
MNLKRVFVAAAMAAAFLAGSGLHAYTLQTLTFQDGDVNGYAGTVDTWVGDASAHGSEAFLYWGRSTTPSYDYRPAIRFDNALEQVPSNAFILTSYMTLTRSGGSTPASPVGIAEDGDTIGNVVRASSSWGESSTTVPMATPRYTLVQGHWASGIWPDDEARDIDITSLARAWHAGVYVNQGVSFSESNNQYTDIAWHSREAATVANRPKLTVQYMVPDSPRERIVVLSSATVTEDTWLGSYLTSANYGADGAIYIGRNQPNQSGNYGNGLVRFDVASALEDALGENWNNAAIWQYKGAWMGFHNGSGASSLDFQAYPLSGAATWTEGGTTWATLDGTTPWPAAWVGGGAVPAANRVAGAEILVEGNSFNAPTIVGMTMWDVSTTVSNFIYGTWINNGWVFPGYYGTSGGASGGLSSEGAPFALGGPFMIIVMEIPEPASGMVFALAGLAALRRGRRAGRR